MEDLDLNQLTITIGTLATLATAVIGLLVRWGLLKKATGESVVEGVEKSQEAVQDALIVLQAAGKLGKGVDVQEIAKAAVSTVKSSVTQVVSKKSAGVRESMADVVAKFDVKQKERPVVRKFGSFLSSLMQK